MAEPTKQPAPLPEVDAPTTPVVVGGVEEYGSSEEFARAHAAGLAKKKADEEAAKAVTETQKVVRVLDKYIVKYSKTTEVRKMAKAAKVSADHQLDVAADIVEILEKIKIELRGKK